MSFDIVSLCAAAKKAAPALAALTTQQKNAALAAIAARLLSQADAILAANAADVKAACENGTSASLIDRLTLTQARIDGICAALEDVIALPDPVGHVLKDYTTENGLHITQVSVPIGVIGVIYEARPNVSVDVAGLCLKSGNVCVLRGGKEAYNSNKALAALMRSALADAGFDPDFICFVDSTDRAVTGQFLKQKQYVDCIIPRGSAGLIRFTVENSTVPVIETGAGICHVYVDEEADLQTAVNVVDNAKTSRPSVCNAAECLLVHRDVAAKALPPIAQKLGEHGVQLRCCPESLRILEGNPLAVAAVPQDYGTEYGDYKLSVKVVTDVTEAIAHIAEHSTHHSEAIITSDPLSAAKFQKEVDAAAVYWNASTRFTDGGEFGFGGEIGISTQKLHARGPMGILALTSYQYQIDGNGQIR